MDADKKTIRHIIPIAVNYIGDNTYRIFLEHYQIIHCP
jgi:hypothetical protein